MLKTAKNQGGSLSVAENSKLNPLYLDKTSLLLLYSARLDQHHLIRYELKKRGLITDGPNKLFCGEKVIMNGQKVNQDTCHVGLGKNAIIENDLFHQLSED